MQHSVEFYFSTFFEANPILLTLCKQSIYSKLEKGSEIA